MSENLERYAFAYICSEYMIFSNRTFSSYFSMRPYVVEEFVKYLYSSLCPSSIAEVRVTFSSCNMNLCIFWIIKVTE